MQRIVAEVAALATLANPAGTAKDVLVVTSHADLQHSTLHRDRPHPPLALDESVLHFRSRLISICSALTRLAVNAGELASAVGLDPVEQRLIHHTQRAGGRRDAMA